MIKFFCVFALLFISKEDRPTCPRRVPVLTSTKLGKKDVLPPAQCSIQTITKSKCYIWRWSRCLWRRISCCLLFRVGVYDVIFLQRVHHITPAGSREEFFGRRLVPTQVQPPLNHGSIQCLQKVYDIYIYILNYKQ